MRVRTAMRHGHRTVGLAAGLGLVVLSITGLVLMHPEWLGRDAGPASVVGADPWRAGRLLRAAPFVVEESLDGGASWRELPLHTAPAEPTTLVFAPRDSGVVWLLGAVELIVSHDGGAVWRMVDLPAAVGFDEPARDLALPAAAAPLLTTDHHGWRLEDGAWHMLWHRPPTRSERWGATVRRLHNGHWGWSGMLRLYDVMAVALVLVVITGLGVAGRRNGRNGRSQR